jgi:2'-hydroxyisoflavone reductase
VTNPGLFPDLAQIRGDRDGGLGALAGRDFDVVLDTSGYVPRVVAQSAAALSGRVGLYVFISSIAVYDMSRGAISEDAALRPASDPEQERVDAETYGPLKVGCEKAVHSCFDGNVLVVRPGVLAGPYDPLKRFGYWPLRARRGGDILAPGPPGSPIQILDVRDLADWIVRAVHANQNGVYNAVGPGQPLTFAALLAACIEAGGEKACIAWVPPTFLRSEGVRPRIDLPLWIEPEAVGGYYGIDATRARAAGLTLRSLKDTVETTLHWELSRDEGDRSQPLSPQRESELLHAWRRRRVRR